MPIQISEWRARIGCFVQRLLKNIRLERQSSLFEQSINLLDKLFGSLKLQREYEKNRGHRQKGEQGSTSDRKTTKTAEPYASKNFSSTSYAGSSNITAKNNTGSNDGSGNDALAFSSSTSTGPGQADKTRPFPTFEGVKSPPHESSSKDPRTIESSVTSGRTLESSTESDVAVEPPISTKAKSCESTKARCTTSGFDLKEATSVSFETPHLSLKHPCDSVSVAESTAARYNDGSSSVDKDIACIGESLLLQAGDVERNPGPDQEPGNLTALELCKLAELMDPDDYRKVGLELGVKEAQLRRYKYDIRNIEGATYRMLSDWLKRVPVETARPSLVDALRRVNLVNLAQSLAAGLDTDAITSLSDEDVQRLAKDLKEYYALNICQVQVDPMNFGSLVQFEDIFTNLKLQEEMKNTNKKVPLEYSKLLDTKVNGAYPKRLLLEGEGGAGKSTLCSKIAWDWLKGRCFQQFKLVLVVLLRHAKGKTVGGVIRSYLPDSNPVDAWQIDKYILTHENDALLVFDGLDEYDGDLESAEAMARIMHRRQFEATPVLVTSRPWRADEIRRRKDLRKAYAFIAVEGFTPENLASYIEKFFADDTTSAADLIQFMQDNDVIAENMSPFPIFAAMLCIMWREYDGERRLAMRKLKTYSQLFREMIDFLIDHYIGKHCDSYDDVTLQRTREAILALFESIGKIALQGLLETQLVFSEEKFRESPGAVDIGCKTGVLSRERHIPERRHRKPGNHGECYVQFPHKLFQEYLAGSYLASLYQTHRWKYVRLIKQLLNNHTEFKLLLYFTSALDIGAGLDIISRVDKKWGADMFIVDLAFECHDPKAIAAVEHTKVGKIGDLTIDANITGMPAHTVSGYLYIVGCLNLKTLTLERRCGRTTSREVADCICTSESLRQVRIKGGAEMHDDFYKVLADQAQSSQIESLDLEYMKLENASASHALGQFMCKLTRLTKVHLYMCALHDGFFTALASMAPEAKIESLDLDYMKLKENASASRDLGQFVCKLTRLTKVHLYKCDFHDGFFTALASMAPEAKIESLDLANIKLRESASASRDLGQFMCKLTRLTEVLLFVCDLHDGFFTALASMAPEAQIESLQLMEILLYQNASASRDLGLFIGRLPGLTKVGLSYCSFHDDFFTALASMAPEAQAAGGDNIPPSPLTRLVIDDKTLSEWRCGNMSAVFPSLQRVTLVVNLGYLHQAKLQLPSVTVLHVVSWCGIHDASAAYPWELARVFPHLIKLTVSDFTWSRGDARSMLDSISSHPSLRLLRIRRCGPDEYLDSAAKKVNLTGRMNVTIDHRGPRWRTWDKIYTEESDDEDIDLSVMSAGPSRRNRRRQRKCIIA